MEKPISELIYNSFTADLTVDEKQRLELWLSQSEQNRLFYDRVRDRETILLKSFRFDRYDQQRAWRSVNKKLHPRRIPLTRIARYAAAVLIPALVVLGFLWRGSYSDTYVIEPGSEMAELILSNGEVLQLYKDRSYALATEDGFAVKSENGEVSFELTGEAAPGAEPRYHTVKTPRGAEFKVVLADGSAVWLNAESSLEFPSHFEEGTRKVAMTGEGYFDIQKNDSAPFIVEVSGMSVEVLGTQFNLRSYGGEAVKTTLVSGSVAMTTETSRTVIKPGQQGTLLADGTFAVQNIDVQPFIAWRQGYFCFDGATLADIMTELGRWYDVDVAFDHPTLERERFSLEVRKKEDFENILELLQKTKAVSITTNKREVYIKK